MQRIARIRTAAQWVGLFLGPGLAATCYAWLPHEYRDAHGELAELVPAGRATLAVMVWMAVWWLTEAIDISATALLPLALFPLTGVADMKAAAAPYAHPLIFLFLGGFLFALSIQRWGLSKRIALSTLRLVGTRPTNMIGGFMLTTAGLSAFVSNTATAAMMLPIAMSVVDLIHRTGVDVNAGAGKPRSGQSAQASNFAICLMLGIAYAASLGGIMTIIGTPPNVFLISYLRDTIAEPYRIDMSFDRWLLIGAPVTIVFLPLVLILLTRVFYPIRSTRIEGGEELIRSELRKLGPVSRGEWATLCVFLCTATLWITRRWLTRWSFGSDGYQPLAGLTDPGIAMIGALCLFVIPVDVRSRQFVLDWETGKKLPWGILVLFGGGLSLAAAVETNGVAEFFGSRASLLAGMPDVVLILVVTAGVIFLTELTSNLATTATLVPVLAALAPGMGVHPYLLIFPAAIAASCAFMLPVATPPNAIVFASGQVTLPQMAKAGLWLNLIGIALVTTLAMLVIRPQLGL